MRALLRPSLQLSILLLAPAILAAQAPDTALKQETPGLLAQTKVTPDSARHIAMRRIPGGVIQSAELEREDGKLVYSFDIKVAGKEGTDEVLVNAITGHIVAVEHEDAASEAAEARADSAKKHGAHAPTPAAPAPKP